MVSESRREKLASGTPAPADSHDVLPSRMFLHESGWEVALKRGSEKVYCHQMAPGQEYYHRLLDGEIFVSRGTERLCLACAERRGLLSFEPRRLRPSVQNAESAAEGVPLAADFGLDSDLDLAIDEEDE